MAGFNIDESPMNRDWTHSKWKLPAYRTAAFFKKLASFNTVLAAFKGTAMYRRAVLEGAIVDDKWVPPSRRKK